MGSSNTTQAENIIPNITVDNEKTHENLPVTRKDMETYISLQLQVRQNENDKLKDEIARIQQAYKKLSEEHTALLKLSKNEEPLISSKIHSSIDNTLIDKFVKSLIDDPNVNINGVPDFIEQQMYKRLAHAMLVSLEKILDHVSFEIVGHTIKAVIVPSDNTQPITNNQPHNI